MKTPVRGRIGTLNSFELGYQGIWGDKWAVSYDFYTYSRTGFTRFTQLAPSYVFTNQDAMPNDLAAGVVADLIADPTINATVLGAISQQYAAQGIPLTGIPGVAPSAAAQAAGTVAAIAGGYGLGFVGAGQALNSNPQVAAAYPIIGAIEADGAPQDGMVHAASGYRRFGRCHKKSLWNGFITRIFY